MTELDGNHGDGERDVPLTRAKRPIWLPHFLGRVPLGLEAKHLRLIGVVALAAAFESFDQSVLTAALKQIRESFSLSQAEATSLFAWIRLGAVPAFLVVPLPTDSGGGASFLFRSSG